MTRAPVQTGYEHVHAILGAAARAANAVLERPHCGGPLPILPTREQLRVGLRFIPVTLAQRVADGETLARGILEAKQGTTAEKWILRAATHYLYAPPSARNAVGTAIEKAVAIVQPDLDQLDQAINIAEISALLAERPHSEIKRVISRPANSKGKLGAVIAQLADGYGTYVKLGTRWRWEEGPLRDIVALMPDELLPTVGEDLAR